MKKWSVQVFIFSLCLLFFGCTKKEPKDVLKIAATPVPHAEMLEFVKPSLKKQGIDLQIIVMDDYSLPNRALANKEVEANFFQDIPFLDEQIKQFGYKIQCYALIHLEPMGIYSDKIKSLKDLKEGAIIAVPNDPTNEYRALALCQKNGLITLKKKGDYTATVLDIATNPKNLRFKEINAALLTRTLKDVDAAVINTNFALQAGLNPDKDAIALESKDSPYANAIVIRDGEGKNPKLEALKKEMLSKKMRIFILTKYKGAIIPVLKECGKKDAN